MFLYKKEAKKNGYLKLTWGRDYDKVLVNKNEKMSKRQTEVYKTLRQITE